MVVESVVCRGRARTILFAVRKNGRSPAEELFETLSPKEKASLLVLFQKMAAEGHIINREHFRQLEGKIYEFKRSQLRFLCYFTENKEVVLTHGFYKKQQKAPRREIVRALRIKQEHEERGRR